MDWSQHCSKTLSYRQGINSCSGNNGKSSAHSHCQPQTWNASCVTGSKHATVYTGTLTRRTARKDDRTLASSDTTLAAFLHSFLAAFICWNTQRGAQGGVLARTCTQQGCDIAGVQYLTVWTGREIRHSVCRSIGFRATVVRHCTKHTQQQRATVSVINFAIFRKWRCRDKITLQCSMSTEIT